LWISTRDHARFGLLILRKGKWGEERIVSESWIDAATRQQGKNPGYGYLWWLNTNGAWRDAPRSSFAALGAGNNSIWIDPEHDLVVVWRWHRGGDAQAQLYRKIIAAIK
jgi:CubicO group peptidase (beta-lactamase class C family)